MNNKNRPRTRAWIFITVWAAALATLGAGVHAEPLPADELERACWLQHTRERTHVRLVEPTAVDVSNLRDGMTVNSPVRVDFSIRGMGVIPAGKPHPKAGHHHMLLDASLPSNPGTPIPFNDFHKHFGKGQTGVAMALTPGKHSLRLLFADHDHKPYFVYSPEIHITVRGPRTANPLKVDRANFDASCQAWYEDEIAKPRPEGKRAVISNLRDGEPVVSPVNVRFAVDGFGVAPKGFGAEGQGHFMFDVLKSDGSLVQAFDLGNGATQATLYLGPGSFTLRLRFVDDSGRVDLVPTADTRVTVAGAERL
jgi:hypothetical protein